MPAVSNTIVHALPAAPAASPVAFAVIVTSLAPSSAVVASAAVAGSTHELCAECLRPLISTEVILGLA